MLPIERENARTFPTVVDLSDWQYKFVNLDSNNMLIKADEGESAVGVLQNAPVGIAGRPAEAQVITFGETRVVFNASGLTEESELAVSGSGGAKAAVSTNKIVGAPIQRGVGSGEVGIIVLAKGTKA